MTHQEPSKFISRQLFQLPVPAQQIPIFASTQVLLPHRPRWVHSSWSPCYVSFEWKLSRLCAPCRAHPCWTLVASTALAPPRLSSFLFRSSKDLRNSSSLLSTFSFSGSRSSSSNIASRASPCASSQPVSFATARSGLILLKGGDLSPSRERLSRWLRLTFDRPTSRSSSSDSWLSEASSQERPWPPPAFGSRMRAGPHLERPPMAGASSSDGYLARPHQNASLSIDQLLMQRWGQPSECAPLAPHLPFTCRKKGRSCRHGGTSLHCFSLHPVLVVGVRHTHVFKLEESSGKAPGKLRLNRRDTSAGHVQLLVLEVLLCHLVMRTLHSTRPQIFQESTWRCPPGQSLQPSLQGLLGRDPSLNQNLSQNGYGTKKSETGWFCEVALWHANWYIISPWGYPKMVGFLVENP